MKATGENLRQFPSSAQILVAAKLKPTRFLNEAVATDSQVAYRYCTEQPLATAAAQFLSSRTQRLAGGPPCTSLSAPGASISAVVLAAVEPLPPNAKACKNADSPQRRRIQSVLVKRFQMICSISFSAASISHQ